jgi:hypothetical protein
MRHGEDQGQWNKVLKRLYLLAGRARSRQLRKRATRDVLADPSLTSRIADYMRVTGTFDEYLQWTRDVREHPEQIYPDVNLTLIESFLRLEPDVGQARVLRSFAISLLRGGIRFAGCTHCEVTAPLLLLRFADRRSAPTLLSYVRRNLDKADDVSLRASAITYSSFGSSHFTKVRDVASTAQKNFLAMIVRLIERIREYESIPEGYAARLTLRNDAVQQRRYVDMRTLLSARLLMLNSSPNVRRRFQVIVAKWKKAAISGFDVHLIERTLT